MEEHKGSPPGYVANDPNAPPANAYPHQQYPPQQYPPPPGAPYSDPATVQPQSNVVTVTVPTVTVVAGVGEAPCQMTCPNCHNVIITAITYELGMLCWLIVLALFIAGCFVLITWFFCCIPCCIPACKDVVHSCPSCNQVLGRHKRMG